MNSLLISELVLEGQHTPAPPGFGTGIQTLVAAEYSSNATITTLPSWSCCTEHAFTFSSSCVVGLPATLGAIAKVVQLEHRRTIVETSCAFQANLTFLR